MLRAAGGSTFGRRDGAFSGDRMSIWNRLVLPLLVAVINNGLGPLDTNLPL